MAYTNPCNLSINPINTGSECDAKMLATAAIILVPKNATWLDSDVAASPYNGNFTAFVEDKIHATAANRWYPLFGNSAPINNITEANEADVTETLDDGSTVFIRYGKANRTFSTTKGGYHLAAKLMQLRQSFSFIEVDIDGNVANYKTASGANAGFPIIMMKGLAPDMANLKTSFKNKFMLTFDKVAYFVNGKVTSPDSSESVLAVTGLLDTDVSKGTVGSASTTNIYVKVITEDAQTDLVALYTGTGAGKIGQISNFVVTAADGTPITPSAVAVSGSEVQLTGTFTTSTNITVALAAPSVLKANGLPGYEGKVAATIAIP